MSEQRTNLVVESRLREYALACSKAHRAGKFTRVSADFINTIEAEVENLIRQIESKVREPLHGEPDGGQEVANALVTGWALERCQDRLNAALRKIIRNKVQSTPSCGQTL